MQRLICAAVFFASAARPVTAGDEDIRFWSDNTGTFTLRAELLQVDELGGSVLLEAPDGERHRVELRRLSDVDHEWLKANKRLTTSAPTSIAGVQWFANIKAAQLKAMGSDAGTDDKPIMCFRALGDLSGFM